MSDTPLNLLATLAERCSAHPKLEGAVLGAVRATLPGVIQSVLRELFPGETVRLYVPKIGTENRTERDARIAAALEAGVTTVEIAKSERITERHVRNVRRRFRGNIAP